MVLHLQNQLDNVNHWRLLDSKNEIVAECHAGPYSAHRGVQRNLIKVRQSFYWKAQSGDVRTFVGSCKICQTEKSDHYLSKGHLQSPALPVQKWK